jgi:hypothetical protein
MAAELPYLASYKNVEALFEKIKSAKVPEGFSQNFLESVIGLKAKGDRPLIGLLKQLGFLDSNQKPTAAYSQLKNPTLCKQAMANAIRNAYRPLFDSNENAHKLQSEELRGLIAQVSGVDDGMARRILGTFNALMKLASFDIPSTPPGDTSPGLGADAANIEDPGDEKLVGAVRKGGLRTEFHYNIQIHLPQNGSEETYLNIFNAIKSSFR